MRFTVILIALLLLPVMAAVHVWDYSERLQPKLADKARAILQQAGIQAATVDLRYLDLSVTGDAPDAAALERATTSLEQLEPTRLVHNGLSIRAQIKARLEGSSLVMEGWLPADSPPAEVNRLLADLRPDLKLDTTAVRSSANVRWPDGEKGPLAADSPLLKAVVAGLRVAPSLDISPRGDALVVSGVVPDPKVKEAIVAALTESLPNAKVEAGGLRVTHYIESTPFARAEALVPFLRRFYSTPVAGRFSITSQDGPSLQASAIPSLQSEWLGLLRPLSGGKPVKMDVKLYPSVYHIPGYRPITPLPVEKLEALRQTVSDFYVVFDVGSTTISASSRVRLAGLVPALLAAGPNLKLVIGGHPDTGGQPAAEKRLALARAEQVVSYLVEQGAPTTDIQAVAFEAVTAGAAGAPLQNRSVEILIK